MSGDAAVEAAESAFRTESRRAFATVARVLGDLSVAEDAVQEAFTMALRVWPRQGIPDNPGAWITTTARNRGLDRMRRESRRIDKERAAVRAQTLARCDAPDLHPVPDDQLRLLFTCCHPALSAEARVALTLRLVCGLTTVEIGRASLQAEATVAQRIVRAKRKIRDAGIPLQIPTDQRLGERLPYVLACVYSLFTEGYAATSGEVLVRDDLCDEAVRLASLLTELLPDEPEAHGLLALVLLHDARRQTRTDNGKLTTLQEQDRARWDRERIERGLAALRSALRRRRPGPYQVQAAIVALHVLAPSWEATDWRRIVQLYERLAQLAPSPVVDLNRAVAVSYVDGVGAGLALLERIADEPRLSRSHLLPAARADLLRRLGRDVEAAVAYREALGLVRTEPERRFLRSRLAGLGGSNLARNG